MTNQSVQGTNNHSHVKMELRELGLKRSGINSMEAHYLENILPPTEHIGGVIYGWHEGSLAMIAATDERVIFLDVKLMFVQEDEITYDVVSGVSFGHAAFWLTVTLRSRTGDYVILTPNKRCVEGFVAFIEQRCLQHRLEQAPRRLGV